MSFTLYKISSPVSPKFYIGITSQTLEERFRIHLRDKTKHRHKMAMWLRKYHESAKIAPIAVGLSESEAMVAEQFSVAYFKLRDVELLLNTLDGGKKTHLGIKRSEETRRRISEAKKGSIVSDEQRAFLSKLHTGAKRSPETCARISAAKKTHRIHQNTRAACRRATIKPVALVDDSASIEFDSVRSAGDYLGISYTAVTKAARRGKWGPYKIIYL